MLTAGLAKVRGGWLDVGSQATFGRFVIRRDVFNEPVENFDFLQSLHFPVLWEALDYFTVVLECGVIVAALSWRYFYPVLCVLVIFHLAIWPTMGIMFPYNLLAYAAFLPWTRIAPSAVRDLLDRSASWLASRSARRAIICGIIASLALLLAYARPPAFISIVYGVSLIFAGAAGLVCLVVFGQRLIKSVSTTRSLTTQTRQR